MVLLLGLHGHGGWCEVGSRLSVGHCRSTNPGPSENWRPELLELCSVFCVLCSVFPVVRAGLGSPDLSCQRGTAD